MLDLRILDLINDYIKLGSDGSLPGMQIRREMYKVLEMLPVEKHHLKESKVGETLMKLLRHPNETTEHKKVLDRIIKKWTRLIFQKETNYREIKKSIEQR